MTHSRRKTVGNTGCPKKIQEHPPPRVFIKNPKLCCSGRTTFQDLADQLMKLPSPRVPGGMVPPLGLNLHGRKGPNGEEVERRQAAAQADIQLHVSPKNLLGLRDRAVTMATLVLSSMPCHWLLLFLLLLFSGMACLTDNQLAPFPVSLQSLARSASFLSLHFAFCFLSASL